MLQTHTDQAVSKGIVNTPSQKPVVFAFCFCIEPVVSSSPFTYRHVWFSHPAFSNIQQQISLALH